MNWLVMDMTYLCYRAFYAVGGPACVVSMDFIYMVLRDIISMQHTFGTDKRGCVFAFDLGRSARQQVFPAYKRLRQTRRLEDSDEEKAAYREFHCQTNALCVDYLPSIGFRNVFAEQGFEADDIIASIAKRLPDDDEAVIVGSDHDLWQCLRPNVWCWNPQRRRAYTAEMFRQEWKLEPKQWADVKAYAGCSTDDIPGVPGVGEKTAAKWLRGELNLNTRAAIRLSSAGDLYARNSKLVRLPFSGTPEFVLRPDEVTEDKWKVLADRLGMQGIYSLVLKSASRRSRGGKREDKNRARLGV